MASTLIETLKRLKSEPMQVLDLYGQLYSASFLAIVKGGTERAIETSEFLMYPTVKKRYELPLFTSRDYLLKLNASESVLIHAAGPALWHRLLDIIKSGESEVAVDPGQPHSIALTREMVLGMTIKYGSPRPGA